MVASKLGKLPPGRGLLETFSRDAHAKSVRELDDRLDECRVAGRRKLGDERAVELDGIDREVAKPSQRGVAGAEVVDRDHRHAQSADRVHDLGGDLGIAHDRSLGDLEVELTPVDAVGAQQAPELFGQPLVHQGRARDVDGRGQIPAGLLPTLGLAQGLIDQLERQRPEQRIVLDQGDELGRLDSRAVRTTPSHQRLRSLDLARRHPGYRLEVELEVAGLESALDIGEES